jgi:hypothetical protein
MTGPMESLKMLGALAGVRGVLLDGSAGMCRFYSGFKQCLADKGMPAL